MLYPCPECGNSVSDKAERCPKCGYPLKEKPRKYNKKKRPKLPNGFGQISEIKNRNLKNPFRAMITVDKTVDGRPVCEMLRPNAYFKTYNDAYTALLNYNRLRGRNFGNITMQSLFDEWFNKERQKLSTSRQKSIRNYWLQCQNIYQLRLDELTISDIKTAISSTESYNYRLGIKGLISRMLNYAVEHEYITASIMKTVDINLEKEAPETEHHMSYTDEEMDILWQNINDTTEILLFQCYTGFRPSEMLGLKLSDVNITERYIIGGMKTEAGKNRIVPIHSKIYEIVCSNFSKSSRLHSEYLFSGRSTSGVFAKISLSAYQRHLKSLLSDLGLNTAHSPHDGRKQFITMAKRYGVDEYAIKRIVGHMIKDITESVYTDRPLEWLKSEIEKIK